MGKEKTSGAFVLFFSAITSYYIFKAFNGGYIPIPDVVYNCISDFLTNNEHVCKIVPRHISVANAVCFIVTIPFGFVALFLFWPWVEDKLSILFARKKINKASDAAEKKKAIVNESEVLLKLFK